MATFTIQQSSLEKRDIHVMEAFKNKNEKHMEFSIGWVNPPPNIWKIYRYFLLSKNDFLLSLKLFIFSPLKYQKYLENFHNYAKGCLPKKTSRKA